MVPSEISGSAGSSGPGSMQGVSARRGENCFLTGDANPGRAGVKTVAESQQETWPEAKTEPVYNSGSSTEGFNPS